MVPGGADSVPCVITWSVPSALSCSLSSALYLVVVAVVVAKMSLLLRRELALSPKRFSSSNSHTSYRLFSVSFRSLLDVKASPAPGGVDRTNNKIWASADEAVADLESGKIVFSGVCRFSGGAWCAEIGMGTDPVIVSSTLNFALSAFRFSVYKP